MVDKEIILRIPVSLPEVGVDLERIAAMLGYTLTDYNDGRYPFNIEMFQNGLSNCLKTAIRHAVEEREEKLHKGEYVPHYNSEGECNGKTAKWVFTSEEAMKGVYTYIKEDEIKVQIV